MESIKALLSARAKPNVLSTSGASPLAVATLRGHQAAVEALLAGGAIEPDMLETVRNVPYLFSTTATIPAPRPMPGPAVPPTPPRMTADERAAALREAAAAGDVERARGLLALGPEAAACGDAEGDTALHLAARAGNAEMVQVSMGIWGWARYGCKRAQRSGNAWVAGGVAGCLFVVGGLDEGAGR